MVDEAKAKAGELLARCSPSWPRASPIVGLEPSCLLTLRDEMTAMGLGEPAQALASSRCCWRNSWPGRPRPAGWKR
jgi:hypothetical protein